MKAKLGRNESPTAPSPEVFLLRTPLYEYYALPDPGHEYLNDLRYGDETQTIDTQCPYCGLDSIFRWARPRSRTFYRADTDPPSQFQVNLQCQRDTAHVLRVIFRGGVRTGDGTFVMGKIGQAPSLADLQLQGVGHYRPLLGDKYAELTRGIGLAAHGVGIGSFVYMRRVFEALVDDARDRAAVSEGWDEGAYRGARMSDRIAMLGEFLPTFLVENRSLYGILSKGVHELTESECLAHFDTVRVGIEMILDERLEAERQRSRLKEATKAIARLGTKLAGQEEDEE